MEKRNKSIFFKTMLLLWLLATGMQAQDINRLSVPDITGAEGETVALPVMLDNTNAGIVALQFDLLVPSAAMSLNTSVISLSERREDHIVAASAQAGGLYRVMVYSPSNKPFKGSSGEILRFTAQIADAVDHDIVFPIELSNVVMSDANGNNVATGSANGTFKIKSSPDFTVSDIRVSPASIMPGDTIDLSWTVNNIGTAASTGGWSERVCLVARDGTEKSLGTFHYDTPSLGVSGSVKRSVMVPLPALPGIDGDVKVRVALVPHSDSGEDAAYQGNNTTETSGYAASVGKRLILELPASAIGEGTSAPVRCRLSRTGSWNAAQAFTLSRVSGDSRLSVPASVTISEGLASAYFYVTVSDNDVLDNDSIFRIQASSQGYMPVEAALVVEDDELPQLTLTASRTDITEGETFLITVTTERASAAPIVVSLVSEKPRRFSHPATITLPAGETSATAEVTAIDNEEVELQESIAFRASAEKHWSGECIILLDDNDLPAIDLELSPATVTESAGPTAIVATLRRTTHTDKVVTIHLSDDSNGDIYYPASSITLDKGVEQMQFSLGIVDNATAEGDRQVNITAAVYVASCSCAASGTSVGAVTRTIEIIDDDGPSLSVSASKSTLLEGDEGGIVLTIARNTDTDEALTVSIGSDYDEGLSYERSVSIPAGAKSADVTVKALANSASGDDRTIVFTTEAPNHAKGTCWVMLTDQTLPDALITGIRVSGSEVEAGGSVDVSVTISNVGAATLPDATKVGVYLSNGSALVANLYTQQALAPGEQATLTKAITLPATVGSHEIYAVANDGQAVKELLYVNNTSERVAVRTTAPFTTTVSADKAVYQQGETVQLSGRVTGNGTANTKVEIYVINDGLRQTIAAVTDENGNFTATYQPYSAQMGHFAIGACYPGEKLTEELASFDIFGLRCASSSRITCDATVGTAYTGTILLENCGTLPLTGVKVNVLSKPDCTVTFDVPTTIAGESTASLDFSITGNSMSPGNSWEPMDIQVETAEGALLNMTIYCYFRNLKGALSASIGSIKTTMIKGSSRDYPFVISNIGRGETGKITFSLPSWMTTATPGELPSLSKGDSVTVMLRLTPTDDMQLNVPVTGNIGINCENGNGLSLKFSVEPVSESMGTLVIDVCDEYTYYTSEAPHVKGAQVIVKHPATKAIIAQGVTADDGTYSIALPEGYYTVSVTAEKHDSYSHDILIDPGVTTLETVNLSTSCVSVTYTVEETEIEDRYTVVTTYTYETNVPAPAVVVSQSGTVDGDHMAVGETTLVYLTLTNKGLITANKFTLYPPSVSEDWKVSYLVDTDSIDIAPQQSYVVPVRVTKLGDNINYVARAGTKASANSPISSCMAGLTYYYEHTCGKVIKENKAAYKMALKTCVNSAILNALMQALSGGTGKGGGELPNPVSDRDTKYTADVTPPTVDGEPLICDPNAVECADKIIEKLGENAPGIGPFIKIFNDVANNCADAAEEGRQPSAKEMADIAESLRDDAKDMVENIKEGNPASSKLGGLGNDAKDILLACYEFFKKHSVGKTKAKSYLDRSNYDAATTAEAYGGQILTLDSLMLEFYGDKVWYDEPDESIDLLFEHIGSLGGVSVLDADKLMNYKPESVSTQQFRSFIERMNGTNPENFINWRKLSERCAYILQLEEDAAALGYESMADMYHKNVRGVYEDFSNSSSSVCSKVRLQLSQTITMTRQAFRGTLTVTNGSNEASITNMRLTLNLWDEEGKLATSEKFQINAETLTGFAGNLDLTSGWSLEPGATGVATILFIPTKYAAEQAPQDYTFGGVLSYVDPYTGLEMSRELSTVTLTVKPSPNLDLTYFMQRDVYGDDPLTKDVVEPCQPAEFALLISNKGYGKATNVRMVTNQPEIVENEKGLLVDFELLSSQLNGKDKTLALGSSVATDFGTIPANSTAYAQWWLQSSLLGHFTDYDVKATHVTSYGNEDLSLLDNVTIHELIHGFTANDATDPKVRGFLVNDIVDAEDMPDMVYFTDGRQEEEVGTASVSMTRNNETEYTVTIVPSESGWCYGSTTDLTAGRQNLISVVRKSDGAVLPADNFWLTDRTLRDGKDPLNENRLHAVAKLTGTETFVLTFEPKPDVELEIEGFTGIPEEGKVLTEQLKSVGVRFNKAIDAATFTTDDLRLTCQGKAVDASKIVIGKVSDAEFTLDIANAALENGYYVLTVQTSGITDHEGFTGTSGKAASWIQYADGAVTLTVNASPAEGGTVSPASSKVAYNSEVTLKATPAEGYEFAGWKRGDETVSEEASFSHLMTADEEFTAVFTLKHFNVDIEFDATRGIVENAASGIYAYGTELQMKAIPFEGYRFDGWTVDGEMLGTDASFVLIVKEDIVITAGFSEDVVSGLEEATRSGRDFTVYPLPLRSVMYVDGNFGKVEKLEIFGLDGIVRIVHTDIAQGSGIDVSSLPKGFYVVKAVTDNGTHIKKVLKR